MGGIQEVQEDFFYDERWTQAIDGFFIKVLAEVTSQGGFWVGHKNMHAMLIARQEVHRPFGRLFGLTGLRMRLKTAKKRYDVTKYLMDHTLVRYDNRHEFIAPGYVWELIYYTFSFLVYLSNIFFFEIKCPPNLRSFQNILLLKRTVTVVSRNGLICISSLEIIAASVGGCCMKCSTSCLRTRGR